MEIFYVDTSRRYSNDQLLRCWQIFIPWLIKRAELYNIVCEPDKEGSSRIISLLTQYASIRNEVSKQVKSKFGNFLLKIISNKYKTPNLVFNGSANMHLIEILLLEPLPDPSLPGDIASCSQIILYRGGEPLFESYDYGTFQILHLHEKEINELKNLLEKDGLPLQIILKQPMKKS